MIDHMVLLGTFLGAAGVADMLRADRDSIGRRRLVVIVGMALAALWIGLTLGGARGSDWAVVGLPCAAALAAWVWGASESLGGGSTTARATAFVGLGGGVVFAACTTGTLAGATWPQGVSGPLTRIPFGLAMLVVGTTLAQVATANLLVRLILDAVGVPASRNEKRLRSGRVLGPMERLFILWLGLAGNLTAAAVVVAAKGLLRYPDLKDAVDETRPNPVSEYFLIGSFASWLFALAALGLVSLFR